MKNLNTLNFESQAMTKREWAEEIFKEIVCILFHWKGIYEEPTKNYYCRVCHRVKVY